MNWIDRIGKEAFMIANSKIVKKTIIEGRITYHLNTGSDRHGRLLDPKVEYKLRDWDNFVKEEDLYFSKEEIIEKL